MVSRLLVFGPRARTASRCVLVGLALFVRLSTVQLARGAESDEPPAEPILPMVRAMGGAYTAVGGDHNSVFTNPAGYALASDSVVTIWSIGVRFNVDEEALDIYGARLEGTDVTAPENIDDYFTNVTLTPAVNGPFQIGRVGNNLGFVFYSAVQAEFSSTPAGITPLATLEAYGDLGLVGGYGFELPFVENLYCGFNVKVIFRTKTAIEGTLVDVLDAVADIDSMPLAKGVGFGGDLGLIYSPAPWFATGLAWKDFFGTRFSEWETMNNSSAVYPSSYIKPRLAAGVAFYPGRPAGKEPSEKGRDFVIALDYADLLDLSPFLSNVRAGLSVSPARFLDLRAGLEGGYFAGGVAFDLKVLHIELAYYVEELGSYPESRPAQNVMLNLVVRW